MLKEISIEILRKCPNNCLHCSSSSNRQCTEIMGYDLFTSIIDDAIELGANVICLSGGEPFIHTDIIKMVSYIHKKGAKCYIYTSGITIDMNENYAPISVEILSSLVGKVAKLIFNIGAATEVTYNKIMGTVGCFNLMKKSVIRANKYGLITEAHFVPTRLNINEIEHTIKICQDLGITQISFLRLVLHGRALKNKSLISLNKEEILLLKKLLADINPPKNIQIRVGIPLSTTLGCHKCEAANGKLNIKYDGSVFPCEVFKNGRAITQIDGHFPENVREKTLKDIYLKSAYLAFVRRVSQIYTQENNTETCIGQYLITKET